MDCSNGEEDQSKKISSDAFLNPHPTGIQLKSSMRTGSHTLAADGAALPMILVVPILINMMGIFRVNGYAPTA